MTIRLFVGCAANGEDAESLAVLEYSVRKHASQPVEIVWMRQAEEGFWSNWNTSRWATPFSGFRWGIPAYCGFQGRAVYVDSDVVFLADIADLWASELKPGKVVASKGGWRFCVSLWDCYAAKEHLPAIEWLRAEASQHSTTTAYFRRNPQLIQSFVPAWNYCDNEDTGPLTEAKVLHYTDMSCQPHLLKYALPRLKLSGLKHWFNGAVRPHPRQDVQDLFDSHLSEAISAGYVPSLYVPNQVHRYRGKADLTNYRGRA